MKKVLLGLLRKKIMVRVRIDRPLPPGTYHGVIARQVEGDTFIALHITLKA